MNTTKKSMWPLLLFIVSSLWLSTHTLARDLGTRECVMWFPWLEWSLENETWEGNPFELGTRVTFQHIATGRAIGTDMFYDGNSTWKFRFAGTMEGMWKLVTVSEDPELNGHTGTINVKKNPNKSARGFMVNNNQKWAWIGTNKIVAPQFVMYKSLDKIAQDPEALDRDIDLFLNGHGFSGFHLPSVSMGWFDLELAGKGSDSMNDDNPNPDLETFTVLEDLIGRVYQAGGSVHIWLWGDESRKQTPVAWGINQKVDHRFQQYFTARLGMLPGWSVGYGYDLFEWTTLNQLQSWYSYMHRHLPLFRFLGARPQGPKAEDDISSYQQWNQTFDYASFEHHRPDYEDYLRAVQATEGMPVFSEDRFRIRVDGPWQAKDYDLEMTRRGIWHAYMAGGVANIWGNLYDTEKKENVSPENGSLPYPNREQLKTCFTFFRKDNRLWVDMHANTQISEKAYVLKSADDKRLIVYQEDTDVIEIDFPDLRGNRQVIVLDAKKPYEELELEKAEKGPNRFQLPYASDWAIAIGKF